MNKIETTEQARDCFAILDAFLVHDRSCAEVTNEYETIQDVIYAMDGFITRAGHALEQVAEAKKELLSYKEFSDQMDATPKIVNDCIAILAKEPES